MIVVEKSSSKGETLMAHRKNTTNLTELLLQCVAQPDPMLSMLEWADGGRGRSAAGRREKSAHGWQEAATAAVIVLAVWIPEWARCTSWCPRFVRAATFRSLSQSASAVKPCSYRWFRKPSCRAFSLEKWRSWYIASALKIYPEARSAR